MILSGKSTDQAIADLFKLRSRKVVFHHRTNCVKKTLRDNKRQTETMALMKQDDKVQQTEKKEMLSAWNRFIMLYDEIISTLEDAKTEKNLPARIASLKELREHIKLEFDVSKASMDKEYEREQTKEIADKLIEFLFSIPEIHGNEVVRDAIIKRLEPYQIQNGINQTGTGNNKP